MRLLIFLVLLSCSQATQPSPVSESTKAEVPKIVAPVSNPLSPMESIQDLDRKIGSYKTGNLTPEESLENERLKKGILRGTFEIYEVCRLALDSHWEKLSKKQQDDFVELMTALLERKAIFSKEQVKGSDKPYQVQYKSQTYLDPQKTKARVITSLTVPSEKITLAISYLLNQTSQGWRIFDVIVDEASLVDNYKFQFDTIIKKSGFDDLVGRMRKKLKDLGSPQE